MKILLVEDDPLVAMMLEDYLDVLGHRVISTCEAVAPALARIEALAIDAVIVDVHLADGELSGPVVEALRVAAIPFLVTTGGHHVVADPAFKGTTLLEKPFTLASLEAGLSALKAQAGLPSAVAENADAKRGANGRRAEQRLIRSDLRALKNDRGGGPRSARGMATR